MDNDLPIFIVSIVIIVGIFAYSFVGSGVHTIYNPIFSEPVNYSLATTTTSETNIDIPQSYATSPFRVLAVIPNTAEHYQLVIVNDRRDERGNEDSCGSNYSPRICYFFIEPLYWADAPTQKFVGVLTGEGGLQIDSIRFLPGFMVEFQTSDGDAGEGFLASWRLDIKKQKFTKIKTEQYSAD